MEKHHLEHHAEYELKELKDIYIERGLDEPLALQVANQLMEHDALGAHLRDELGIHDRTVAQPLMAAVTSAASFTLGAAFPLVVSYFTPLESLIWSVAGFSILFLIALGGLAAKAGGASKRKGAFRVVFWGAAAMFITALVGRAFGGLLG